MYCRMCGAQLNSTDRFCKICGTKMDSETPAESPESIERKAETTEEVVFNPPYEEEAHHNRFYLVEEKPQSQAEEKEALCGFISDHEVEKQRQDEELGKDKNSRRVISSSEFNWNVHDFTNRKKTEDTVFDWNLEDYSKPEQKEAAAVFLEEELFREIRDESSRIKETNIDRFFTFSKKNEEFQKLLDKEYEKLRRHPSFPPDNESQETLPADAEKEEMPAYSNEALSKAPSAEHAEELHQEKAHAVEDNSKAEIEHDSDQDSPERETVSDMAQARAEYFNDGLIKDNDAIIKKLSSADLPVTDFEQAPREGKHEEIADSLLAVEQDGSKVNPIDETKAEMLRTSEAWQEVKPAETAWDKETAEFDESSQNRGSEGLAAALQKVTSERSAADGSAASGLNALFGAAPVLDGDGIEAGHQQTETVKDSEKAEGNSPADQGTAEAGAALQPETVSAFGAGWAMMDEENRSSRKKHRAGQIVLIIIAIILVFEIAILSIRFFAPDSSASRMINETQTKVINVVTDWFHGINGLISGNDSNQDTEQDSDVKSGEEEQPDSETPAVPEAPKPDPVPMADKAALVATQLHKNANIKRVANNDSLVFDSSKDYGIADLNQSKSIENNIWMEKDGQTVYYDQSIVGTIIAFDSQWIDYVNSGNKAVLSLLKKDSPAYKKAVGFTKVGKIKEIFNVLEIGEIRQGSDGFYVWVHEEIEITEKGVTTAKKYNWIYYLEPVDGNLNIVNYFKFK